MPLPLMTEKKPLRKAPPGYILIIDDQEYIRVLLTDNLEFDRFETTCASTGKEALACAARRRPDVAIVDVSLPDMSGWDVCRSLLKTYPGLAIVVLSAQNPGQAKARMQQLGLRYFVAKPYDPLALSELIKQIAPK